MSDDKLCASNYGGRFILRERSRQQNGLLIKNHIVIVLVREKGRWNETKRRWAVIIQFEMKTRRNDG